MKYALSMLQKDLELKRKLIENKHYKNKNDKVRIENQMNDLKLAIKTISSDSKKTNPTSNEYAFNVFSDLSC